MMISEFMRNIWQMAWRWVKAQALLHRLFKPFTQILFKLRHFSLLSL